MPGAAQMYTHNREWVGSKSDTDTIKIMHRLRSEMKKETRNRVNRAKM